MKYKDVVFLAEKILRNRTQFSSTLRNDLYESLQQLSKKTDVPLSKLLDRAVEAFLKNRKDLTS
jgi:predicted DNA-binding protein